MFATFLTELYASSTYKGWAQKHPREAAAWRTYATSIMAGSPSKPPSCTTAFGNALLQVALLATQTATHSSYGESTYG